MGSLFGKQVTADGGDSSKKPHKPYRYCVTRGWSHEWVHCPLCRSKNNGWLDGRPQYTGGSVLILRANGNSTTLRQVTVACYCEPGRAMSEATGIKSIIDFRPEDLDEPEAVILWDMDKMGRPPRRDELPPEPSHDASRRYVAAVSELWQRHAKGLITGAELRTEEERLRREIMPPPVRPRVQNEVGR